MRLSRFIPAALAVVALSPEISSAQQVQFLGAKHTSGNTVTIGSPFSGQASVGPYLMSYTSSPASVFDIYCIDFDHTISSTPYNARVLTFADAVNASLSFNGIDNFTALKRVLGTQSLYGPLAGSSQYLANLKTESALAGQFGASPNTSWDENHYAMWSLFNTNTIYSPDGSHSVAALLASGQSTASASGYNYANWRIIIDESAWDLQARNSYQQVVITEVATVVPEPGTYALMGMGLLALGVAARRRNRTTQDVKTAGSQLA